MPETCTCGTTLVDDARFCHRCGRPVFETETSFPSGSEADTAAALKRPPLTAGHVSPENPLAVSFRNPVALRVAFIVSAGILMIEMIPGVQLLFVLWWMAAGWGAVSLYKRFTGCALSVAAGARLGSITGILIFAGLMVITAVGVLLTGRQIFDEMAKQNPQITPMLNDPAMLAGALLLMLCMVFAMVVGMCAAGGALGARWARRSGTPAA